MENTFTSIEDVAPRLFPLLGLFVGPRRWFPLCTAAQPMSFCPSAEGPPTCRGTVPALVQIV